MRTAPPRVLGTSLQRRMQAREMEKETAEDVSADTFIEFYFHTRHCTPSQRWPLIRLLFSNGLGLARIRRLVASTPPALHRARCAVLNSTNISRLIATLGAPSFIAPTQLARMTRISPARAGTVGSLWLQRPPGSASVLLGREWKKQFVVPAEERRQLRQWQSVEAARFERIAIKTQENVKREATQRRAAQRAAAAGCTGDAEVDPDKTSGRDPFDSKREVALDDVGGLQPMPPLPMPAPMPAAAAPPPSMRLVTGAVAGATSLMLPPMPPLPGMLAMPPVTGAVAGATSPTLPPMPPLPGTPAAGAMPPMPLPPTAACAAAALPAVRVLTGRRKSSLTASLRGTVCAKCKGMKTVLRREQSTGGGDAAPTPARCAEAHSAGTRECVMSELKRKVAAHTRLARHAQNPSSQMLCLVCAGTGRPAGRCPNWSLAYSAEKAASVAGGSAGDESALDDTSGGVSKSTSKGKGKGKGAKSKQPKRRGGRHNFALDYAFVSSGHTKKKIEICTMSWPPFDAVAHAVDTLDVDVLERCSGASTMLSEMLGSGTGGLSMECCATLEMAASITAAGRAARAKGVATPELDPVSARTTRTGGGKIARAKRRGAEHFYLAVCDIPNLGRKITALLHLGLGGLPTLGVSFNRIAPQCSTPSEVVASLSMLAGYVRAFSESKALGELLLLLRDVANGLNERKEAEVRDYRPAVGCSLLDLAALDTLRIAVPAAARSSKRSSGRLPKGPRSSRLRVSRCLELPRTALYNVAMLLDQAGRGDIFQRIGNDIGSIQAVVGGSFAMSARSALRSAVRTAEAVRALNVAAEGCSTAGETVCAAAAAHIAASNGAVREMEASALELHGALHTTRLKFAAHLDPSVARTIEASSAALLDRARPGLLAVLSERNAQRGRDEFFSVLATFSNAARIVAESRMTATKAKKAKKQRAKRAFAHDGGTRATAAAELAARRARAATERVEAECRRRVEERRAAVGDVEDEELTPTSSDIEWDDI